VFIREVTLMQREHLDKMSLRNFKGGSWDLRKTERRTQLQSIGFPDRRANDRRFGSNAAVSSDADMLQWVTKSGLDE
jgi:hypothetical protein